MSIGDERLVDTLFQLIICFGIHYNLEDHIGIPIEKLSKYGVNITKRRGLVDVSERNKRLFTCLSSLMRLRDLKREHIDVINAKLYRKYIHELLCGLIQITCSPSFTAREPTSQLKFVQWRDEVLFDEADGSVIISGLLMAQSSARFKRVDWFLNKIGKLLTKCLLRPNSVMNVIRAVLNDINAVSNVTVASDWKKCDLIAQIVAQCPKEISTEEYVKFLSPQLVDLYFHFDVKYSRHFCRVAGSIYSLMAQRWPALTRTHITSKLLLPLSFEGDKSRMVMSCQEFLVKLEQITLVFISSTEPSWTTLSQIPMELVHLLFQVNS